MGQDKTFQVEPPMIWDGAFIFTFFSILVIPFVPSLREWMEKHDALPLDIQELSENQAKYFLSNFKRYAQLETSLAFVADDYYFLDENEPFPIADNGSNPISHRIVVADSKLNIPSHIECHREVLSQGDIVTGDHCRFQSLCSQQDIDFGDAISVTRWVYAQSIIAGHNNAFRGSVYAENLVQLHPDTRFRNIQAGLIRFGSAPLQDPYPDFPHYNLEKSLAPLLGLTKDACGRWIIETDMIIPDEAIIEADIIARGNLGIGKRCLIKGSVKSYRDLTIDAESHVTGSIVSQQNIFVGYGCHIQKQVISEQAVYLKPQAVIGSIDCPATLTAKAVYPSYGVHIYGAANSHY